MVARPSNSSNLLALALLLASLALTTNGQASTEAGGGGAQVSAETNVKIPLEPLGVSTKSAAAKATTAPVSDMLAESTGITSSVVDRAGASVGSPLDMEAIKSASSPSPPLVGSGSSSISSSVSSETRASTTSGPNPRATSSHSVHVSTTTSSSKHGNQVHTFQAHQDGDSPPEVSEEFHAEPGQSGAEEEHEETAGGAYASASASVDNLEENNAPWPHDYHLEPPKIIDYSSDGMLSHQHQQHQHQHHHGHHDASDDDEDDDDDEEDDEDDDDHQRKKEKHHHKKQQTTYVPRLQKLDAHLPPVEHVDETYIDTSDPNDPKKVHYSKEVKAHVGPNGESYQHQESKTSNSLGANPNSHSYHHSSSSSSYVTSHSGSGGGNYKHYEPYLGVNQRHGKINKHHHHNRVHHAKPYQHQVQGQHGHYEPLAPLPALPSLPGMEPLFQMPAFPKLPSASAGLPSAWLDVAQPGSLAGYRPKSYSRGMHPSVQHGSAAGHVHYGPDEAIKPAKLSRLEKRAENMKRRLAKLQAKRRERLERGQYSELEDFL